jgi:glutamine synthetase
MAAIIAMGLYGIKNKLALGSMIPKDPHALSEEERKARGIKLLPNTIDERKDAIYGQPGKNLREYFTDEFINNIVMCHLKDFEFLGDRDINEEVSLLIDRY